MIFKNNKILVINKYIHLPTLAECSFGDRKQGINKCWPNYSMCITCDWILISYSLIVLYSRDRKGVGVAHEKHHPKTSLTFP